MQDWCWSWNSNTLATCCEELTHLKRPWCWERLKARGGGDDRGWDGWMASPTQWTWVWVISGSWWWTGRPGVLQSMGSQRVRHDWATKLNWTAGFSKLTHPCVVLNIAQSKSWKLCFIRREFLELQAQEAASQISLREALWGSGWGCWGARLYRNFVTKGR